MAEQELSEVLDNMQERGIIQKSNRVDIKELVNNPTEKVLIDLDTDEEIRDAVLKRRENEQNADINGGDDGNNRADPAPVTRREALAAIAVLQKFLVHDEDQQSRVLEGHLARFGRRTRREAAVGLQETEITQYFAKR